MAENPIHVCLKTAYPEDFNFEIFKMLVESGLYDLSEIDPGYNAAPLQIVGYKSFTDGIFGKMGEQAVDAAKLLLDNGVDVNSQDVFGATCLYYACYRGNYNLVKFLLDNGANPNLFNSSKKTPLDNITQGVINGNYDTSVNLKIKKLLKEHGAKFYKQLDGVY